MKSSQGYRVAYLVLSMLSGFVELGAVVLTLRSGGSLAVAILIGLCYQVGAFVRDALGLSSRGAQILLVGSAIVASFSSYSIPSLALSVLMLAAGLQVIREQLAPTAEVSTVVKRSFRIAGFVAAGWFGYQALPLLAALCLFVSLLHAGAHQRIVTVRLDWRMDRYGLAMLIHQCHYFCYAYAIPWLFLRCGLSSAEVGLAFAAGWISYASAHLLFGRVRLRTGLILGHIIAAATIIGVAWGRSLPLLSILAWIATGFGGGTVVLLRRLHATSGDPAVDLDLWESVGHVAGCVIGLTVVLSAGLETWVFYVAASLALATAALIPGDAASLKRTRIGIP